MFIVAGVRPGELRQEFNVVPTRATHFTPKGVSIQSPFHDYKHSTTTWLFAATHHRFLVLTTGPCEKSGDQSPHFKVLTTENNSLVCN